MSEGAWRSALLFFTAFAVAFSLALSIQALENRNTEQLREAIIVGCERVNEMRESFNEHTRLFIQFVNDVSADHQSLEGSPARYRDIARSVDKLEMTDCQKAYARR